jgi:hypothetical protein
MGLGDTPQGLENKSGFAIDFVPRPEYPRSNAWTFKYVSPSSAKTDKSQS